MQDITAVRTAAELEKKYGLYKLAGMSKNLETNSDNLIKLQNELNNTINSLIINLGDVLDSQTNISLWFYQPIPTTTNEPYISWQDPSEHIGDLYYAQDYGYVYKYTSDGWIQQNDNNLIQSMAITNEELDIALDHERKVYFQTPTTPYESGDWWIRQDGELYVCQLSRASGEYQEEDFIIANKYTPTIASADGDIITIKQGQIIKLSDTFASFTDLATGGSTTIAGENITTGNIKSSNYVQGVSGTLLNLQNGTIDSKNFKVDSSGNLNIGGYLTSTNGILSNFQYVSKGNTGTNFGNYNLLGYNVGFTDTLQYTYTDLELEVFIPQNFEIISAELKTYHSVVDWYDDNNVEQKGYARNIKVFKAAAGKNTSFGMVYFGEYIFTPISNSDLTQIASIGTPTNHTNLGQVEELTTVDIKNSLTAGLNKIIIRTGDSIPVNPSSTTQACQNTGLANAILNVIGYMKID